MIRLFALAAFAVLCLAVPTKSAQALCTGPGGVAGEIIYNSSNNILQYCDNANWIGLGGNGQGYTVVSGMPDAIKCTIPALLAPGKATLYQVDSERTDAAYKTLYRARIGSNDIWINFNGTTGAYIDNSGNIGASDCTSQSIAQLYAAGKAFNFVGSGSGGGGGGASQWTDVTGGINYSGGSVGVGTATPATELHISKAAAAAHVAARIENTNTSGYSTVWLGSANNGLLYGGSAASVWTGQLALVTPNTGTPIVFGPAGVEKVRIDGNGNVGIGTTAPKGQLQLGSAVNFQEAGATGNFTYNAYYTGGNWKRITTGNPAPVIQLDAAGVTNFWRPAASNTDTAADSNISYTSSMRITATGDVGIGTTTPQSLLHVAGGIQMADDTAACPGASNVKVGTLKYVSDTLSLCKVAGWTALSSGSGGSLSGGTSGYLGIWTGATTLGLSSTTAGNQLFWDATNNRLGIGTNTPNTALHVSVSAGRAIRVQSTGAGTSPAIEFEDAAAGTHNQWAIGSGTVNGADGKFFIYDSRQVENRLTIDTAGFVGIGTMAPDSKLNVVSTTTGGAAYGTSLARFTGALSDTFVTVRNTTVGGRTYSLTSSGTGSGIGVGSFNITDDAATVSRLSISSAGNIGLGTTNPGYRLTVVTPDQRMATFSGSNTDASLINIINSNLTQAAGGQWAIGVNGSAPVNLPTMPAGSFMIHQDGAVPRLTITPTSGNVGIGTVTPVTKLEVYGGGTGAAPATSGTTDVTMNFRAGRGGSGLDSGILDDGTGYLQVRNMSNFATNYYMSLNPNGGNVGIGTAAPGYKLSVAGIINSTQTGAAYYANGLALLGRTGNYTTLYDSTGAIVSYLGNTSEATNYYDNTSHVFRVRGGATSYATINAGGLSVTGNVIATGIMQPSGFVYPGRADTGVAQGSWYLASHPSYGLYSNTGMYLAGNLTGGGIVQPNGYIYPGNASTGAAQGGWFLSGHNSYGLYTNTGLYAASHLWSGNNVYAGGNVIAASNVYTGNGGSWLASNGDVYMAYAGAYLSGALSSLGYSWSDQNLKTDIKPLETSQGLETIMKLRPVDFNWRDLEKAKKEGPQLGFIAQELEEVLPGVVHEGAMRQTVNDGKKKEEYQHAKMVNYGALTAPLTKAVQELKVMFDDLSAKVATLMGLKDDVTALQATIKAQDAKIEALETQNAAILKRLDAIEGAR